MTRVACVVVALALVAGCDFGVNQGVNVGLPVNTGGITTGGTALVTGFVCVRDVLPSGLASSAICTWAGNPGPHVLEATRARDGAVSVYPGATSGISISPGPEGDGGGVWTVVLQSTAGAVLATTTVTLDS